MYLCIDPGSKHLGYAMIEKNQVINSGVISMLLVDYLSALDSLCKNNLINLVIIEQGDTTIRYYEKTLLQFFQQKEIKVLLYHSKTIRKKLRLERHPSSEGYKAKLKLANDIFPHISWDTIPIHILDSALLYVYHQKICS